MKLLNNIGIVGASLAAFADIIFVIIMVLGVHVEAEINAIIIFAVINALIGILINVLLRYQGQKYAEIENDALCKQYYNKKIKEKKYMSMGTWMGLKTLQDFAIKGGTTAFSIFGIVYISITGSHNPIQILLTLVTLILFACFGLIGMNSAYCRFYNIQVPYMQLKIQERENVARTTKNNRNNNRSKRGRKSTADNICKENKQIKGEENVNNREQSVPQSTGTSTQE